LKSTISSGLISNPCREDFSGMIQISVPISSGSSGGALIDQYGDVIGITTAGYLYGQNLNFAIPVTTATALARGSGVSLGEMSRQQDLYEYAQIPEAFSDNYDEIEPNNTGIRPTISKTEQASGELWTTNTSTPFCSAATPREPSRCTCFQIRPITW
jgi:hypothetical protein